jgi:hypothetical protein
MRTPLPPNSGRIRLTISVTPEVHDTFLLLAEASGTSISRAMGDWLDDTRDGAAFMAETVRKAREAPRVVARELHAYALGLSEMTGDLLEEIRQKGRAEPAGGARPAGAALPARPGKTPPSNTGVTTTKNKSRKGGNDGQNAR